MTDPLLEELQTPVEAARPWYTRWWGIVLVLTLVAGGGAVYWFVAQVNYYQQAIEDGNYEAFAGYQIDASQYGKVGTQVSRSEVETMDDPFWGNPQASVVIVEFSDFQCPYCRQNHPALQQLRATYADKIKFIYRDFPLTAIHPESMIAAQAASCAHDQQMFWPYHDVLFARQNEYTTVDELVGYAAELELDTERFRTCLTSEKYKTEAEQDLQEGIRFGVKGTPTFFINGLRLNGVITYDTMTAVIDRYLDKF